MEKSLRWLGVIGPAEVPNQEKYCNNKNNFFPSLEGAILVLIIFEVGY